MIKNIPKGQFIRIKRICSDESDFEAQAEIMKTHFKSRGYNERHLENILCDVRKIAREELLEVKENIESNDPQSVLVCTWHPKLKNLPSILRENH